MARYVKSEMGKVRKDRMFEPGCDLCNYFFTPANMTTHMYTTLLLQGFVQHQRDM